MPYFSGQGRVYIGARDSAGNPQGLAYVGNVPELKVSLSVETLEGQTAPLQPDSALEWRVVPTSRNFAEFSHGLGH